MKKNKMNEYDNFSKEYLERLLKLSVDIKDSLIANKNSYEFFISKHFLKDVSDYQIIEMVDLLNEKQLFVNMNKIVALFEQDLKEYPDIKIKNYTNSISRDDIKDNVVITTKYSTNKIIKSLTDTENKIKHAIQEKDGIYYSYDKKSRTLTINSKRYATSGLKASILDVVLRNPSEQRRRWSYEELIEKIGERDDMDFGKSIYKSVYDLRNDIKKNTFSEDFIITSDSNVWINQKYKRN